MEIDIGKKIQTSRKEANITQEVAAEKLGVTRQTISNWENEKSYPDIISVIKMSDLYNVSLDYLLKGEKQMTTYYDYLEESTNTVKSNNKKSKLAIILSYFGVWAIAMIIFWFFMTPDGAMGYSLMFLWVIIPVATFITSLLISVNDFWGKKMWFTPLVMGIMYMLAEYGTFSMANNITFNKVNMPEFGMIIGGAIISAIGILIGKLVRKIRKK